MAHALSTVAPKFKSSVRMPQRVEVVRESAKKIAQPQNMNWWNIYEAADRRDYQGWFYLPTLNPKEQQVQWTRRALQERVDFLYKNVGAVTMVIDGLALEETGTGLWPKWTTSDPGFNKYMTDAFHYANHDPRIFSADGESDYYAAQYNVRRMIRLYGDCFAQLLRPSPGSTNPLLNVIPGWRVDNSIFAPPVNNAWRDGILRNDLGRRISTTVLSSEWTSPTVSMEVVAADMLHFHDDFLPGQNRGISSLASVAKRLFRREDILKALTNGTLARERLGFALEMKGEDSNIPILGGDGAIETATNNAGSAYTLQRFFGPDADEQIQIPRLPDGAKIATVESNRPGTAVTEFLDHILREVCWATIYPSEYIFFKAGMGQGTVARLVLQQVTAIAHARRSFQLKPQFCNRWNVFWAWQRIISGTMPKSVKVPADWWMHKILADADKSVDLGREGRLYDERVATGKMSIERYHALSGEDAEDVEDENFAIRQRRMDKLKKFNEINGTSLTYFDMWPPTSNNPQVAVKETADITDTEDV